MTTSCLDFFSLHTMTSPREAMILILAIIIAVEATPTCMFDRHGQTCTAGDSDYVLTRGLVSDNNRTGRITLRECRITSIDPDAFRNLFSLRYLDLSVNKLITMNPDDFEGANYLTHLNLSYNSLTDLPLGLFEKIPNLELLDLKRNRLTSLKQSLFDPLTRIGHLDLSSNSIYGRYLDPNLFEHNKPITFMDFSGSDMSDSPDGLLHGLEMINFLNLAGCSLEEVPKFATAPNLKPMWRLMMIYNQINRLDDPATFINLINLEIIDLDHNNIETINKDVFKNLSKLKTITLTNNKLKNIPDTLFQNMASLNSLDLSRNQLENVPVNAFRGAPISNFDITGNKITYLTDNFCLELRNSGTRLKKFLFSQNPWQCACLVDLLKEVKSYNVEYNSILYNGKVPVCATTREFNCKRDRTFNNMYINMYNNYV